MLNTDERTALIAEVAHILKSKAAEVVTARLPLDENKTNFISGSLMWAMISAELNRGSSKEELVSFVGRLYDLLKMQEFN